MIRRVGRKMEHRGKVYKELDHWYDEECQWKKKETKVALKEYKIEMMTKMEESTGNAGKNMKKS
jgi:hypothetical protein